MKVRQILTDDGQFPFTFPIGTVILGVVAKTVVTLSGTITLENPDANNVLTEETLPIIEFCFTNPMPSELISPLPGRWRWIVRLGPLPVGLTLQLSIRCFDGR